jgi:hypothetical protein
LDTLNCTIAIQAGSVPHVANERFSAAGRGFSQLIKNVTDVPAAVDVPDDLDDTGTLAVENQMVTICERRRP